MKGSINPSLDSLMKFKFFLVNYQKFLINLYSQCITGHNFEKFDSFGGSPETTGHAS